MMKAWAMGERLADTFRPTARKLPVTNDGPFVTNVAAGGPAGDKWFPCWIAGGYPAIS